MRDRPSRQIEQVTEWFYSRGKQIHVRWFSYMWYDYTGDQERQDEPIEFLHTPIKYKCWGKGVVTNEIHTQ